MKKITVVIITLMLAGCIFPYPHNNWKSPAFFGQVVHKGSGQPISEAKVFIKGHESDAVKTDSDGNYELAPIKDFEWLGVICPGPCDALAEPFIVVVSHNTLGTSEKETMPCIGHPDFVCNGRKERVDFSL
ncbi:MAG: carboxypeptidase-like regulatory domain-containing protein [Gammaproteobacteria bacterium]|nr:carboxypeptidase-like regulatory domain-containing protein [Gammaproteobacteria bacterium]